MTALIGPVLLLLLGGFGWIIKNQLETTRKLDEQLFVERRKIYEQILEPYIIMFSPDQGFDPKLHHGKTKQQVVADVLSSGHKKLGFELMITAPDNVALSYNRLMQYVYKTNSEDRKPAEMFDILGRLMLEIRKSVGNPQTKLDTYDMFAFFITDIDRLRPTKK